MMFVNNHMMTTLTTMMMMMMMMMSVNSRPHHHSSDVQPLPPSAAQSSVQPYAGPGDGGRSDMEEQKSEREIVLSAGVHDSTAERSDDNNAVQLTSVTNVVTYHYQRVFYTPTQLSYNTLAPSPVNTLIANSS